MFQIVCPALAGMSPVTSPKVEAETSLPRTRGDEPEAPMTEEQVDRFALHSRG